PGAAGKSGAARGACRARGAVGALATLPAGTAIAEQKRVATVSALRAARRARPAVAAPAEQPAAAAAIQPTAGGLVGPGAEQRAARECPPGRKDVTDACQG